MTMKSTLPRITGFLALTTLIACVCVCVRAQESGQLRAKANRLTSEQVTTRSLRQAQKLVKQAEAVDKKTRAQQRKADKHNTKIAALKKQKMKLDEKRAALLGGAVAIIPEADSTQISAKETTGPTTNFGPKRKSDRMVPVPEIKRKAAKIKAEKAKVAKPKKAKKSLLKKLMFWKKRERSPGPEFVAPPAQVAAPVTPQRAAVAAPVTPVRSSQDARALAEDIVKEKSRARSLMVRELYQRGLILYRQKQYSESVSQFQRALSVDPNHRESRRYLRLAQSALARGTS